MVQGTRRQPERSAQDAHGGAMDKRIPTPGSTLRTRHIWRWSDFGRHQQPPFAQAIGALFMRTPSERWVRSAAVQNLPFCPPDCLTYGPFGDRQTRARVPAAGAGLWRN